MRSLGRFAGDEKALENHVNMVTSPNQAVIKAERDMALRKWDSDNTRESWEKGLIAKAKAQIASAEKHKLLMIEIPKELPLGSAGEKNINKMSNEDINKLSQAVLIGAVQGLKTLASTLLFLTYKGEYRVFWKQVLKGGKFKITKTPNGGQLVMFYNTKGFQSVVKGEMLRAFESKTKFSLKDILKWRSHFDALVDAIESAEKISRAGAISPGASYASTKGFMGIQLKSSWPFFSRKVSKIGFLEKFINGKVAASGAVIGFAISATVETYTWIAEHEDWQWTDLMAIWGVVIVESAVTTGLVLAASAATIAFISTSVVIVIAVGVIAAVAAAWAISSLDSYFNYTESAIMSLRGL
jgi:hypothetical protein